MPEFRSNFTFEIMIRIIEICNFSETKIKLIKLVLILQQQQQQRTHITITSHH